MIELERLVAALEATDVVSFAPAGIRDLAYDTRAVEAGALFFCVPGDRHDGHELAPEAVERGAAALVVERPVELPGDRRVPQLVVPSVRKAMPLAADEFFGRPSEILEIAAVTGTNGKTTTSFLMFAILAAAGQRPGLYGTIEARVGGERRGVAHTTPEAIDLQRAFREMLDAGDRSCAMEASSHASAMHRLDRVRFAALVFTNLTLDHLDFHGTMESYYQAKRRLFFEGQPPAAINVGNEWGRRLATERPDALTFALDGGADLGPELLDGVDLKLRGRFNSENALGAFAAGRLLGIEDASIVQGLESVRGVPGRFESIEEGQPFGVIVDYAHTPDALANVLRAAHELAPEGRLLCVFGCGGDRDREKRPQMGRIASELADLAIVTSDNPRSEDPLAIIEEIRAGIAGPSEIEPDRAAAIRRALEQAREGDIVVIAGKGHEQGQEFADRTLPFDDRDAARDALRALGAAA